MFQDDERALAIERTAVASVRVDLVNLALWADWMNKQGVPPKSVNQAVSSALNHVVNLLKSNGQITASVTLAQAEEMLSSNRLFQRGMYGRRGSKLRTFTSFESMREEGDNPRMSNKLTTQTYEKFHGNDEKVVMPLDVEIGEKKSYSERKVEKLTEEDKEKLIEMWNDMSEEEQAVFQRTPYRTEQDRIDAFMMFYPRFRGDYPKEYENAETEVYLSDEYQEWMNEYFSKRDGFLWAMKGFVPEKAMLRKRLEFDENGVVKNVVVKPYDVTPEYVEKARKKEEAQKERLALEKEQEKIRKQMAKEEVKQREKVEGLKEKEKVIEDKIEGLSSLINQEEELGHE